MEKIIFDKANKDDISELVRLRIAYMYDDLGELSEDDERAMREHLPGYYERELGDHLIAFVARADGRIVATAYLLITEKPANPSMPNGMCGEVLSVYTEEAYRGKGICTHLMEDLIAYGREHKLSKIDLLATGDGYHVYEKVGFKEKHLHYTDMRLDLTSHTP